MVSKPGHTSSIANIDGNSDEVRETVMSKCHGADGPSHVKTLNCPIDALKLPYDHLSASADVMDCIGWHVSTELDEMSTGHDVIKWSTDVRRVSTVHTGRLELTSV